MSFADDLEHAIPARNRFTTGPDVMTRILDALGTDDRAALEAALANPARYPATALAEFLTGKGFAVSRSTITVWRRRNGIR